MDRIGDERNTLSVAGLDPDGADRIVGTSSEKSSTPSNGFAGGGHLRSETSPGSNGDHKPTCNQLVYCQSNIPAPNAFGGLVRRHRRSSRVAIRTCFVQCLFTPDVGNTLPLLFQDGSPAVQEAARALTDISSTSLEKSQSNMRAVSDALPGLVKLLAKTESPGVQKLAAQTIGYLASAHKAQEHAEKISRFPNALADLVQLLKHRDVEVQQEAVGALARLSHTSECKQMIMETAEFLGGLVQLLGESETPLARESASWALVNLALPKENKRKIIEFPDAVSTLLRLLGTNENPNVQMYAAAALMNLAAAQDTAECVGHSSVHAFNCSVGLVLSSTKRKDPRVNPKVQAGPKSGSGDEYKLFNLTEFPCGLEHVVKLMSRTENPGGQLYATMTLRNLSYEKGNRTVIGRSSDALKSLVKLMCDRSSPRMQEEAAATLESLALEGIGCRKEIADAPNALEGLVGLLYEDKSPGAQEKAMGTICAFSSASSENTMQKVVEIPDALPGIVRLLHKDGRPEAQLLAAITLRNISSGPELESTRLVGDYPNLLVKLLALVSTHTRPRLQEEALATLRNLSRVSRDYGGKILDAPGAVPCLVRLLDGEKSQTLPGYAAETIGNFSRALDDKDLTRLGSQLSQAIDGLVRLLAKNVSQHVQEQAVYALSNLAEANRNTVVMGGAVEGLVGVLDPTNQATRELHFFAAKALTLIDPAKGAQIVLHSGGAFDGRGRALLALGMYQDALTDLDMVIYLHKDASTLRLRSFARAMMHDYDEALADLNDSIDLHTEMSQCSTHLWLERGIVRRMMGDLEGALGDLDGALAMEKHDEYAMLKHRGYIKFLMGDEKGARADAESAIALKSREGRNSDLDGSAPGKLSQLLADFPVEFLDFKLS